MAKYTSSNPQVHQTAVSKYSASHPEVNKKAVATYSVAHPEVLKKKWDNYYFSKKYAYTRQIDLENKFMEQMNDRLEAQKLVKLVLQHRREVVKKYLHEYDLRHNNDLRHNKLTAKLTKLEALPDDSILQDKLVALLGELLHCKTKEPYPQIQVQRAEQNSVQQGIAVEKFCPCNPEVCHLEDLTLQNLLAAFKYLAQLTPATLFKSLQKDETAYLAHFKLLISLKHHAPGVRTITREIYQLNSTRQRIQNIDSTLDSAAVEELKELGKFERYQL